MIGFTFASDQLRHLSGPFSEKSKVKQMESRIAFDTQLMDFFKSKGSFYSNPFTFASTMSKLLRCDEQNRGKPRTSQEPNIAKFTLNLTRLVC